MITSDRNVGLMAHLTADTKKRFQKEAERRKMGMSELVSDIIEEWLEYASKEQLEPRRSNKRTLDKLRDIPLPLGDKE